MAGARARAGIVLLLLVVALAGADRVTELGESLLYPGTIEHVEQSPYQRIVVTERAGDVRLHLNGSLQFSSRDEHRYHESLVHPAMASARSRERVLVGGGGDGLAVRENLRWPDVLSVTLVDLDPQVTALAAKHPRLSALNGRALEDPRVAIVNADAMTWLASDRTAFDVMIFDFPDPSSYTLGKLYSTRFYRSARERLAEGGALAVQATSPLFARRAFWCIVRTVESAGLAVRPYHAFVPSFGEWGFVLAKHAPFDAPASLPPADLHFLDPARLAALFAFPADMHEVPSTVSRLDNQAVVHAYVAEWSRWN